MKTKNLAINSTLIVISTTLLGTILHEISHYLVALYFDLNPQLNHNYVSYQTTDVSEFRKVVIAGAGPMFSLVLGIIFLSISIKQKKTTLFKLFSLWFGMNGLIMFLGYLLIAPLSKNGDTGKVFDYYKLPTFVSISIALISFIVIVKIFSRLSNQFKYYTSNLTYNQNENAKQLFVIPIISSTLIITLLNFPIISWVSLLPTIFMPMTFISTYKSYKKLKIENVEFWVNKISLPLIITTIISIGIFVYLKP